MTHLSRIPPEIDEQLVGDVKWTVLGQSERVPVIEVENPLGHFSIVTGAPPVVGDVHSLVD